MIRMIKNWLWRRKLARIKRESRQYILHALAGNIPEKQGCWGVPACRPYDFKVKLAKFQYPLLRSNVVPSGGVWTEKSELGPRFSQL